MLTTLIYTVLIFAATLDLAMMLRIDMQMLQQSRYSNSRYYDLISESDEYLTVKRIVLLVVLIASITTMAVSSPYVMGVLGVVLLLQAASLARKRHKSPLVFTRRVARLYYTELALMLAIAATLGTVSGGPYAAAVSMVIFVTFSYAFTLAANWLMQPIERHINNRFASDAKRRIEAVPGITVIGVTGSHSDSAKQCLSSILGSQFAVLATPSQHGSAMGIVRTVREQLQPHHQVLICEMDASQAGGVRQMCGIAQPSMGIITGVDDEHPESTVFELAHALPSSGMAVVNNDNEQCASHEVANVTCVRHSTQPGEHASFQARDIANSGQGTTFTLAGPNGMQLPLATSLAGDASIGSLMAAVIVALRLGMSPEQIQLAVSNTTAEPLPAPANALPAGGAEHPLLQQGE